jgi:hypothetical protein
MNVMTAIAEAARQSSNIESFLIRTPRSRIGKVERDVSLSEVREVHSTFAEQAEASKQPKGGESPHMIELPIGISIWLAAGVTDSRLSDRNSSELICGLARLAPCPCRVASGSANQSHTKGRQHA